MTIAHPGALLVVLLAACVPATPEEAHLGGIALTLAPSEATAGKPFESWDGWTVVLEKTALRVQATASSENDHGAGAGVGALPRIFDPRYMCELRLSGLPVGTARVSVMLRGGNPVFDEDLGDETHCGVDDPVVQRFHDFGDPAEHANGPYLYVRGEGTKGDRRLRFDLMLSDVESLARADPSTIPPTTRSSNVQIVPDKGAPVRFEVHMEKLFTGGLDVLAVADANADGELTSAELEASCKPDPSWTHPASGACINVLSQLAGRAAKLLTPPAAE